MAITEIALKAYDLFEQRNMKGIRRTIQFRHCFCSQWKHVMVGNF